MTGQHFLESFEVLKCWDFTEVQDIVRAMKILRGIVGQDPEQYQIALLGGEERRKVVFSAMDKVILNYRENVEFPSESYPVMWQFAHNLVVGQPELQLELWSKYGDLIFKHLEEETDGKLLNVVSAIAYQMLKGGRIFNAVHPNDSNEATIIRLGRCFIKVIAEDPVGDIAFPVFGIQHLLKFSKGYLSCLYDMLSVDHRHVLLDVIAEEDGWMDEAGCELVNFLATQFKRQADHLMIIMERCRPISPCELRKLLNLLCTWSVVDTSSGATLKADKSLLITTLYLLRMVHDAGKPDGSYSFAVNKYFQPVRKIDKLADKEKLESDPVFGFKRDLIRLIGNLCHEHIDNQNEVCDNNGIELILDCSPIDGKNPFITQWVILAIRNICLGNPRCQALLASISERGNIDRNVMSNLGVQIEGL